MYELSAILNSKAITFLRRISEREWHAVGRNVSSVLIAAGFALGVFLFVRTVTGYFVFYLHADPEMLFRLVSLSLFVVYVSINLLNLVVSYATLYNAEEVGFLFSLPITQETIFMVRLLENFFSSSSTLSLIVLAGLLGFWSYFALPWYAYLLAIFLVFLPFVMGAATTGVIILMGFVAGAARFGVRWMMGLAVIVYVGMTYAGFYYSDPLAIMRGVSAPAALGSPGIIDSAFLRMVPSGWVTSFLRAVSQGDYVRGILPMLALLGVCAGTLALAWWLAKRYYYRTWIAASELRTLRRRGPQTSSAGLLGMRRQWLLRSDIEALLRRDALRFLRDPVQRLHLLMMGVLLVTFLFSLHSLEFPLSTSSARVASILMIFLFNGFFLSSLALRFVYPSVSLEGDAFWCVRSAPLSLSKLYWMKFAYALMFLLIAAAGLGGMTLRVVPVDPFLQTAFVGYTILLVLGITSVNLGAGAYFGTLKEKNPVRVASSQGASLTFLGALLFIVCLGIGLFVLMQMRLGSVGGPTRISGFTLMIPNVVTVVFTAALSLFVNYGGIRALHKDL